ncbi:hypothetical protein P175DRAFT_0443763 [Aspergillus ochraceoroseus IBT 24754]|uniref:Rhodopsin domain-containing protein n=1 Tax=Aspergillus ochraceoroseus IBT 24754 TaxID=1392256 RepID=A0A2T5LPJ3_9EURO|nr:uncharacterized protein P175DRAFT_0443763 [Aspergillus ochraceoroseus IBT 24754]PTU18197.1 hypothetical protein P175DRAFT_0443763 [Aspergillus ochraceoroseus IBT 24754]
MSSAAETPSPAFLAESQTTTVKAVMWLMSLTPLVFVILRLYVRLHLKRVFGWDDLIAAAAVACLLGYAAVCHAAADIGLGRHVQVVAQNPKDLVNLARLSSISQTLAIMACAWGKTSFAVTLLRIVVKRWMTVLLCFIIITVNVINLLAALFVFVQCKDPRRNWDPSVKTKCWPTHVFTDYSLFVGGIAGAAAIVKTCYLVTLSAKADFTWELTPLLNWAAVEDGLTIIASSIPTLKPLLTKIFPTSASQESYNMLPPGAQKEKRRIKFDTSLYATQVDTVQVHEPADEALTGSQQSILPVKEEDKINLTTEVSVTYKAN